MAPLAGSSNGRCDRQCRSLLVASPRQGSAAGRMSCSANCGSDDRARRASPGRVARRPHGHRGVASCQRHAAGRCPVGANGTRPIPPPHSRSRARPVAGRALFPGHVVAVGHQPPARVIAFGQVATRRTRTRPSGSPARLIRVPARWRPPAQRSIHRPATGISRAASPDRPRARRRQTRPRHPAMARALPHRPVRPRLARPAIGATRPAAGAR
jgi:hypothetical protein